MAWHVDTYSNAIALVLCHHAIIFALATKFQHLQQPTPMSSSLRGHLICGLINPWYYNDHQSSMTRGIIGPCQCQWSTWTKIIPMKVVIKFVYCA